jgi:hypothetical protein
VAKQSCARITPLNWNFGFAPRRLMPNASIDQMPSLVSADWSDCLKPYEVYEAPLTPEI